MFSRARAQRKSLPTIDLDGAHRVRAVGPAVEFQVTIFSRMALDGSLMACRLAGPNAFVPFRGPMPPTARALRVGIANLCRLRDDHRESAASAADDSPAGGGVGRQCVPARTEESQLHIGSVACGQGGVKRLFPVRGRRNKPTGRATTAMDQSTPTRRIRRWRFSPCFGETLLYRGRGATLVWAGAAASAVAAS